tara:strand:- start:1471 stop:1737 length:267 start_codon:yes stop_codon:yes gene_type:complete
MGMDVNDPDYTAELLANDLSSGSVSISDEDDLVDAFKVILGYAATKDAADGMDTKGADPAKGIEDQATAQALAIAQFVLANISGAPDE